MPPEPPLRSRQGEIDQRALPVFPFSDEQVAEVADALGDKLHWLQDHDRANELARTALQALAWVMVMEKKADPMGVPRGYGYRQVRGVTGWFLVRPDESWEPMP